jgi:3-oxoacyl-[acyl-carrier-protein] synthase III
MGTVIKASAVSRIPGDEKQSSVELAALAAEACIARAGVSREDIELLINVGQFKDDNIQEPAMAALIQKKLRMNLDPLASAMRKKTFSFDLMNSSFGFLSASLVIDSLLKTGKINLGMIVAGDVHPSQKHDAAFPYSHFGSSVVLEPGRVPGSGFQAFLIEGSNERYNGYESFLDLPNYGTRGRTSVDIRFAEDYVRRATSFTIENLDRFFREKGINRSAVDHVIITQQDKNFARQIAAAVGLKAGSVIDTYDDYRNAYTSGLIIGFHEGLGRGAIKARDSVVFVGCGAGLNFGAAHYVV